MTSLVEKSSMIPWFSHENSFFSSNSAQINSSASFIKHHARRESGMKSAVESTAFWRVAQRTGCK